MTYSNGIVKHHVDRLPAITDAVLRAGRRRAADQSHKLSRAGALGAAAERCNEAVNRLIVLAYERDEQTGSLANVDGATGVFERFPMPWGRYYGRWGLLRTEADVLALHVKMLQDNTDVAPLWTYDDVSRRWGVNLWDYGSEASALAYWRRCELTAKDYQTLLQTVRSRRDR